MIATSWEQHLRYIGIPGAILACLSLLILASGPIAELTRRLRRRSQCRKSLLRLACGLSFDQFDKLLGPPISRFKREQGGAWRAGYVQIHSTSYVYVFAVGGDKEGCVNAFVITVKRKSFNLPLAPMTREQVDLNLMKARFVDLGDHEGSWYVVGANRYGYAELHYYGNPANYQYYVYAYNDVGVGSYEIFTRGADSFADGYFKEVLAAGDFGEIPEEKAQWIRECGRPNTVAVAYDIDSVAMVLNHVNVGVDRSNVGHIHE